MNLKYNINTSAKFVMVLILILISGQVLAATNTISGTAYQDEGTTTMSSGITVALSINAGAAVVTTTGANGEYSFPSLTLSNNDMICVYLKDATNKATTVSKVPKSDITGFNLYKGHLVLRKDAAGGSLSNANLLSADNGDDNILYTVSGTSLTVNSGVELYILAGHTYAPDGTIDADAIKIKGTINNNSGNNINCGGNFINDGTYTKGTSTKETITLDGGTSQAFQCGSSVYNHVAIINSGTSVTISTTILTCENFTVSTGATAAHGADINLHVKGNIDITGTFVKATGTGKVVFNGGLTNTVKTSGNNLGCLELNSANTKMSIQDDLLVDTLTLNASTELIQNTYNVKINGNVSMGTTTFTKATSTGKVIFQGQTTQTITSSANDLGNIQITGSGTVLQPGDNLLAGDLTIDSGAQLSLTSTYNLEVKGNVNIALNGYTDSSSGGIKFSKAGVQTLSANGNNLGDVTVSTAGTVVSLKNNLAVSNLTIDTGTPAPTFVCATSTSAVTLTISGSGTVTNNGALNLTGTASYKIYLRSSSSPTQYNLHDTASGTTTWAYVDVKDCNASSGDVIDATNNCVNSENNNNINFGGETFSGIVYTDEGVTPIGSGKTVAISVNGGSSIVTTTGAGGDYSLRADTDANNVIAIYLDNNTEKATLVTVVDGNNLSGLNLYQNHLIVRHDNSGNLTNTNLDLANNNGDSDILYTTSTANLTVSAGVELYVWTGKTYKPDGTIDADAIKIAGTLNNTDGYSINCAGGFVNNGTYTKGTVTKETVTFDGGVSQSFTSGGSEFNNIQVSNNSTVTMQDALTINNFTLLTGTTFSQASNFDLNIKGNASIATGSTFTKAGGTGKFILNSGAAQNLTPGTNNLGNVEINTAGTSVTIQDALTVNNPVSVNTTDDT